MGDLIAILDHSSLSSPMLILGLNSFSNKILLEQHALGVPSVFNKTNSKLFLPLVS